MTQVGEGIVAYIIQLLSDKYLFAGVESVTFDSGVKLYRIGVNQAEEEFPPAGTPHWTSTYSYAALYARQGGAGETKAVKVNVRWSQKGCDGSAKVRGESSDGQVVIEGSFSISGDRGSADVTCEFKKKPAVVTNYGRGLAFTWTVTASGETASAPGGTPLRLFFTDAHPKPVNWSGEYAGHYLRIADWATTWAAGKSGESAVLAALWDKFSDGTQARLPHVTGFSYWKTGAPAQGLKQLLDPMYRDPDGIYVGVGAQELGWSCRAIAHTFMECLALNGIKCEEVEPKRPSGTLTFLVHNWESTPTPVNWADLYFAGVWVGSLWPPLNTAVPATITAASGSAYTIDMVKKPGVPAQGQPKAPLMFSNHWIVRVGGKLYDTSYGGAPHPDDPTAYGKASFGGWLVRTSPVPGGSIPSTWVNPSPGASPAAWLAHEVSKHTVKFNNRGKN
jgi:hypothetical protein